MKNLFLKSFFLLLLSALVAIAAFVFGYLILKIQEIPSQSFQKIIYLLPVFCLLNAYYHKKFPQFKEGTRQLLDPKKSNLFFRWHFLSITVSTWLSHFFGASVGRESTALQIGASLATWLQFKKNSVLLGELELRVFGMMMGFSALFGTPFAAVFFVLEISKKWSLKNFFWGVFSSFSAFWFFEILAQGQLHFKVVLKTSAQFTPQLFFYYILLAVCLGLLAHLFLKAFRAMKNHSHLKHQMAASLLLVLCFTVFPQQKLTGLSLPSLSDSFISPPATSLFAEKMLVTLLSSAAGFQGGEVTPLFVIGATFGSSFANFFQLPLDLFAAAALVGLFAAVTRSPWGSFFIGIELFGISYGLIFALVILISLRIAPRQGLFSLS